MSQHRYNREAALAANRHLAKKVFGPLPDAEYLGVFEFREALIRQEIESTDRQIDSLVYGLYGLTADEIAVVEEAVGKKLSPTIKKGDFRYQDGR